MRKRYEFIESEAARQVRLREAQMMREAAAEQRLCRRCGKSLDADEDGTCAPCQHDDWQEDQEWHDAHLADDYDEDEQEGE